MLRSVEIENNMLHNPVKVKPEDNVYDAIHQILVFKVSGVCVVDEDDKLIGVLSEVDCMRAILSAVYNDAPVGAVSEYMTKAVITASLHENIVDVAADMLEHKHRRRPVVDDEGHLIGQVTCRQLLRAVKEFASPHDNTEY